MQKLKQVGVTSIGILLMFTPLQVLADDHSEQKPTAVGDGGAVATEHPKASKAATTILENDGNAVDSAVAAAATQGVTRPFSGGIGGGGFMQVYLEEEDEFVVIDHVIETSENFGPTSFINPETSDYYPAEVRQTSGMATGIPGVIKGWEEALEEYGTMSFSEVLEPAIQVAEEGFAANENFIREIEDNLEKFGLFESTKEVYLDEDGNVPEPGTIMENPDLADTYRLIGEHGSDAFYEGEIAEAIIDTIHNPPVVDDPEHEILAGNMSMDDLSNYEVLPRDPVHVNYRGYDVYSSAPSSSGVTIGQTLNILEGFDLDNSDRTEGMHYFIEASRYAFADRDEYLGDSRHTEIPVNGMLSKEYAEERQQNISDDSATLGQVEPGDPWAYNDLQTFAEEDEDLVEADPSSETIHLSVSDRDGNVVSYTSTINLMGGNGMVVPGYGFLLNNGFNSRTATDSPDHPNYPRPGLRMITTMSPTIIMDDNDPVLAVGSPGGGRIITTNLQVIVNHLDFDMSLPEAIEDQRLSQRNLSHGETQYEGIYEEEYGTLFDELEEMGHGFYPDDAVQGISAVAGLEFMSDGEVRAAAEPERRGGGSAMALDVEDIEDPDPTTVSSIIALVEHFEKEGAFANEEASHSLITHLNAVSHYENQEDAEKVVEHMEGGCKDLLNHQHDNDLISDEAYETLIDLTDDLIEKWQ
ncbi:gamma-glutamyltransferase [Salicibibacter kimchii]|nr:gamma-glutamyltransferase [Salicibibacter kimchii]